MADEINLSTFPPSKSEALAMLYLERQDLSGITPSELVKKYLEVEEEITQSFKVGKPPQKSRY